MTAPVRWMLPTGLSQAEVDALSGTLGVPRFVADLLIRRGFGLEEDARRFLEPKLASLSDPFALPDMEAAVGRILDAVDRRERVALYGDYDVDGVTSVAIMTRILRAYGLEPARFLPHRIDEGYGLSADGVARCVEENRPQLLIAVDCGTSSAKEIATLRDQGIDVIVVDHHECQGSLPECVALVNPKRGKTFHYFCTAGLVFKVAHALLKRRPLMGFDLKSILDLVALGTVADLVPLVDENRILVRRGLVQLGESRWVGIRSLIEVSGVSCPVTSSDVGFMLGPRLNAAGRLGTALDALELLLTEDINRARNIARNLDQQNRERRAVEDRVVVEAEEQIAGWFNPAEHAAIVCASLGWHPGVIGIAASRVQKRYHRPTFVIGFDEEGMGKGSGRSIEGLSLVAALDACGVHLVKFGGHEMAAGLTVRQDCFEAFRDAFLQAAKSRLTEEQLKARLRIDIEVGFDDLGRSLLQDMDRLQPFGMGNYAPTFCTRGVTLASEPRVMKEKHMSLVLRHRGHEHRAVWFNCMSEKLPRLPWDVAFTIERNEYQGNVQSQMQIKAVRSTE